MSYNISETKILYFGRKVENTCDIMLNHKVIEWVDEWSYLGVRLKSGKNFNCTVVDRVKKFCGNFPHVILWGAEPIFEPVVSRTRLTAKNKEIKRSQLTF